MIQISILSSPGHSGLLTGRPFPVRTCRKVAEASTLGATNSLLGSTTITLAVWSMLATCTACGPTFVESGPTGDSQEIRQHTSSSRLEFGSSDSTASSPLTGAPTGDPIIVNRHGTADREGQHEPTGPSLVAHSVPESCAALLPSRETTDRDQPCNLFASPTLGQPPHVGTDLLLRPPLRQLWFRHPKLVPFGSDFELELPDSEILAHRDHVTSGPFRNPYAGFRDQPLFHRDSSRTTVSHSTLPEIGPPPPRHSVKTLATLTGLSLVGIGVYAFAPSSFTGTTKEGAFEEAFEHFKDAWTKPPVFDKDRAAVNYLGHPYFGMNFYLAARNYGESPLYSFLFSALSSTAFEYFIESWSEQPSIQDLLITPIVGSILGELVYRATQEMRKDGFTKAEKIVLTIINPLYVLQNGYR